MSRKRRNRGDEELGQKREGGDDAVSSKGRFAVVFTIMTMKKPVDFRRHKANQPTYRNGQVAGYSEFPNGRGRTWWLRAFPV